MSSDSARKIQLISCTILLAVNLRKSLYINDLGRPDFCKSLTVRYLRLIARTSLRKSLPINELRLIAHTQKKMHAQKKPPHYRAVFIRRLIYYY